MPDIPATPAVEEKSNSLEGLANGIGGGLFGFNTPGAQVSQQATLVYNNRNYLISNNRTLLSWLYIEHGIVQTLVDQPVDDAFRTGFEIKCPELGEDEIAALREMWEADMQEAVTDAMKWARLYGGGSVLMITDQPAAEPLNWDKINEDSLLAFRGVDMWELYKNDPQIDGQKDHGQWIDPDLGQFDYYGVKVDPSRVRQIKGKKAPAFIRTMLRGWGMSEVEKIVRSLNQYLKNQDVIFELLDEAKIDIFKINGLNNALASTQGTSAAVERITQANVIKNFLNALVMDMKDEYDQKQMTFTGLAEMLQEIRIGIAADLKMPMTKLFGQSPGGLNATGESDTENYNAMIEGEIRFKCKPVVKDMLRIGCKKLFGYIPEELDIQWNALRIMSAIEEEQIKEKQATRILDLYNSGLVQVLEAKQAINKDSLMPVEIDETAEALPPMGMIGMDEEDETDKKEDKKDAP